MSLIPVEAKAHALLYVEAVQHGDTQRIFWEAIRHNFGQDEPIDLLTSQLQTAVANGDVGSTAALAINLLKQNALSLQTAATSMANANTNALPLYEAAKRGEEEKKGHHWYSWLSPRRWGIEARQADMEVGADTVRRRGDRWRRYASQLPATIPQQV